MFDRHSLGVGCVLSCVLAVGCSNKAEGPPKNDCAACPTDAGPRPSQGSASLHLVASPGGTCSAGPRWMNVPLGDVTRPTVTGSTLGDLAVDGESGAAVTCSIFLIGGGYAMSGELEVTQADRFGRVSANALISPTTSAPQPISIRIEDEATGPLRQGDCSLVPGLDGAGWGLALAPGRFWGKLVCSSLLLADSDAGASGCAIDEGYIELESCQ